VAYLGNGVGAVSVAAADIAAIGQRLLQTQLMQLMLQIQLWVLQTTRTAPVFLSLQCCFRNQPASLVLIYLCSFYWYQQQGFSGNGSALHLLQQLTWVLFLLQF
jgi:hypothetical protein